MHGELGHSADIHVLDDRPDNSLTPDDVLHQSRDFGGILAYPCAYPEYIIGAMSLMNFGAKVVELRSQSSRM